MNAIRWMLLGAAIVAAGAAPAAAQEATTGTISGQVLDPQNLPLPGVTVTVESAQGPRSVVTDSQGRFIVPFLTPGEYRLRAELSGFKLAEQPAVEVRLGQRAELTLRMEVGQLSETVQVVGTTGVVDVTSASAGVNIDSAALARLPVPRQLGDTLYLAPGVSSGGGTGRANPSISGGSGLDNQYIVDGVNITNPGYGALGSYSIVLGSLGNGVTFDFIQEVQVKTAGYEAQYGQATGGVVNVVTKSGTNQLRGALFAYSQPAFAQADYSQVQTTAAAREETVNLVETQKNDGGVEAGFPVVRNKLFFFGAIDPQWQRAAYIAPIGLPLRSAGPFDQDRRTVAYSGKATWQPAPAHRLDASFFGDPGNGPNGPQRRTALLRSETTGFSRLESFGGHNQTLRYNGVLTSTWLLETSYAHASNRITEQPAVDSFQLIDRTVTPNLRTGGVGFYENNEGGNHQFQVLSTNIFDGAGQHQLRYGLQFEHVLYDNIVNYSGPTFTLSNGQQTVTGASVERRTDPALGVFYRVTRSNLNNVRHTSQDYMSFFVQDLWQAGGVTIRPGLRYDGQKLIGNLADFTFDNNWAPRIGVTWDPTRSGRVKLFANYGLYYARLPNDLAARALSADAGVTRADYFDAALTQPIPEGMAVGGTTRHLVLAGLSPSTFDPNARSTYTHQVLAGVEWEAHPGLSLAVRYLNLGYGRVLEDVGTLPLVAYLLPDVPGAESVEYFITNPGPETPVTGNLGVPVSFEHAEHRYNALVLEASRRLADNWSLQASYRYSRTTGTFEGFFRNDNDQSDPGITSLFDFPTDDPTYVSLGRALGFRGDIRYLGSAGAGPLPNDRRHQGKVYGSYMLPVGLNLGIGLNVGSGRPLTALAANPVYTNAGEIPETPRGDGFETEDGFRTRTPFEYSVDAHIDYALRFGAQRLVLLADAFNLFDTQRVRDYDDYTENSFESPNPDFGRRLAYQDPLTMRFGLRFEF
ncbi:MAG: TonB-dependent receptor [Acidobacteria bacterium]|nr:TonB-dependent receptor [Acidobacteriota bacterium]